MKKLLVSFFAVLVLACAGPASAQYSIGDGKPVVAPTLSQAGLMSGRGVFTDPKSLTKPQQNAHSDVRIGITCIGPYDDDGSHKFCHDANWATDGYGNRDPGIQVPEYYYSVNADHTVNATGSFRLGCDFVKAANVDPIVFFQNKGGVSHTHGFYGAYDVTPYTTHASLMLDPKSSCTGGILNGTAYWFPMLAAHCPAGDLGGCAIALAKYGYKDGHMFAPSVNIYYKCEGGFTCDHGGWGGKVVTASLSGQVLTVTAIDARSNGVPLAVGDTLHTSDRGNNAILTIASFGTGTGGVGTYNTTQPVAGIHDIASQVMNTGKPNRWPPVGLKMIAGNAGATGPSGADIFDWGCFDHAGNTQTYDHIPTAADIAAIGACSSTSLVTNAPGDAGDLKARIHFPNCWDGVNLDSPGTHNAHVAYADFYEGCPAAFPEYMPNIELQLHWQVPDDVIPFTRLASDPPRSSGQPAGYSLHADYLEAWRQNTPQPMLGGLSIEQAIQKGCYTLGYSDTHPGVSSHGDCHDDLLGNPDPNNPTHWLWMQ